MRAFEFYETPEAFTRYLFTEMEALGHPIHGTVVEPCVGSGAIVRVGKSASDGAPLHWITNDIDERWPANSHHDAVNDTLWAAVAANGGAAWTVTNPPFTPAIEILDQALKHSEIGVAMHLRASIHEVLRTGPRRTWFSEHLPTGILWLPRFAYQRSPTTGKWSTDSMCACWVIWLRQRVWHLGPVPQFIRYAPSSVIDQLDAETPHYRERMDRFARVRAA